MIALVCFLYLWSQADSKIATIDSVVTGGNSKIITISTITKRLSIDASHGTLNLDISQIIKYDDRLNPIEVQKIWVDRDKPGDTSQVNSYFFSNSRLIKITCEVFGSIDSLRYLQQIYLQNDTVICAVDSDGKPFDPWSHLIKSKLLLKRIKRNPENWVIDPL